MSCCPRRPHRHRSHRVGHWLATWWPSWRRHRAICVGYRAARGTAFAAAIDAPESPADLIPVVLGLERAFGIGIQIFGLAV